MNSVIMDGAEIGPDSIVGAMSFIKAGFKGQPRQLLAGSPARYIRDVTEQDLHWKHLNTLEYQALVPRCHNSLREVRPLTQAEANRPRLKGVTEVTYKA